MPSSTSLVAAIRSKTNPSWLKSADNQVKCKPVAVLSSRSFIFLLTRHQFSLLRFIHLPFMLSLLITLLDQTAGGYYSPWRLFTYHLGNITLTL